MCCSLLCIVCFRWRSSPSLSLLFHISPIRVHCFSHYFPQRASRFFSHHFLILFFCLFFSFLRVFCWSRFKKLFFPQDPPGRDALSRVESLRVLVFSFFLLFFSSSTAIPRDSYKLIAARILGIVPLRCCGFIHLKLLARRGGGQ